MGHEDRVGQRAANRSAAVKRHDRQQEARSQPRPAEDEAPRGPAHRGDGSLLCDDSESVLAAAQDT